VEAFIAILAINAVALYLMFLYFRGLVRKALDSDSMLDGVRTELRAMLNELNESADRNVTLLEDRAERARELLKEIDKKIELLSRERLRKSTEADVRAKLEGLARGLGDSPGPQASFDPNHRAASAYGRERERKSAPVEAPTEGSPELSRNQDPGDVPGIARSSGWLEVEPTERERALDLYRKGFSSDIIAVKLGTSVEAVETMVGTADDREE
jgi:hypothetical protein